MTAEVTKRRDRTAKPPQSAKIRGLAFGFRSGLAVDLVLVRVMAVSATVARMRNRGESDLYLLRIVE